MTNLSSQNVLRPAEESRHRPIALGITLLLAAVSLAIPAYVFLGRIYIDRLRSPETVEGGIELLVVFVLFSLAAVLIKRHVVYTIIIALIAALYLQTHSVFISAALALLLFESIIQIGIAMQLLLGIEGAKDTSVFSYLGKFILGAATWLFGILILSALGYGTISHVRFYSMVFALIAIVSARAMPLSMALIGRFQQLTARDKIFVLFLLILILTQFGKANYGTDYDSAWYGLRPERVLVGSNSIFDNLRLVHFVYYYPKQFETLSLPLAGLNGGLFIIAFNVVILGIGFLAVYYTARELELDRSAALLLTILIGSLPAFSNMASTAKTDNPLAAYAFLAALFFWRWCKRRDSLDFALAVAALLGMIGAKITAFAFAPLLAAGFLIVGIYRHFSEKRTAPAGTTCQSASENRKGFSRSAPFIVAGIAFCTGAGLALRTSGITGIPTLPGFVGVWKILGLHLRYPWQGADFGFLASPVQTVNEFFTYWYRLHFNPWRYGHYIMAWPGNVGFFSICSLAVLAAFRLVHKRAQSAFLYACIPVLAGSVLWACLMRRHGAEGGTDGNYFAVPVALTVLAVAGILSNVRGATRNVFTVCCVGFTLLHLPIMFVSHWSWHSGTQAFRFSLDKPFFDAKSEAEASLKRIGAWEIEEYLEKNPNIKLCVGYSGGEGKILHSLSCSHEDFEQIGAPFAHIFSSEFAFKKYLAWARPDLLIMPKDVSYRPGQNEFNVQKAFEELAANPKTVRIESERYYAFDVSAVPKADPEGSPP